MLSSVDVRYDVKPTQIGELLVTHLKYEAYIYVGKASLYVTVFDKKHNNTKIEVQDALVLGLPVPPQWFFDSLAEMEQSCAQ